MIGFLSIVLVDTVEEPFVFALIDRTGQRHQSIFMRHLPINLSKQVVLVIVIFLIRILIFVDQ